MPLTSIFYQPLSWGLFTFPPDEAPLTLPPPQSEPGIFTPFHIPPQLYNDLLSVYWPVTVASVYAATVTILNQVNKRRNNKPWAISRTGAFTAFVLAHNIFLTVYSAWTFVGMLGAMKRTLSGIADSYSYHEYGLAPIVDALCKMNGPRGLGSATTYNPFSSTWTVKDQTIKLLNGNPDPTDVGRLWNEGLAFFGWLFYLSKFYEVLDTVIILAKGKRSSLLQTYHHAGAMMCMWAGIRFMSPPIWMFVQFNSGIHALMYFYYTLAALGIKVPNRIKKSLTTLQISQFIIGASFAFTHLVVAYQIPANIPYIYTHGVASAVSSAATSVASAAPTIVAGWGPWLKKAVLRAVGDEGLAENVRGPSGGRFGIDALKAEISDHNRQEIRYRLEYPKVHCLDTSGQAFAIWLNVLYLLPLTYLFGRFFVTSYLKRAQAEKAPSAMHQRVVRSGSDAAKGLDREVRQAMGDKQGYNSPIDDEFAIELDDEIAKITEDIKSGAAAVKSEGELAASRAQEKAKTIADGVANKVVEVKSEIKEESKPLIDQTKTTAKQVKSDVEAQAPKLYDNATSKAKQTAAQIKTEAPKLAESANKQGQELKEQVSKEAPKAASQAQTKAQDTAAQVQDKAPKAATDVKEAVKASAQKVQEEVPIAAQQVKDSAAESAKQAQQKAPEAAGAAKSQASEAAQQAKETATKSQQKATERPKENPTPVADLGGREAHVKTGESYADAVKQDEPAPEGTNSDSSLIESIVEISREDAENLEVNPDSNLSHSEIIAEKTEGQQPTDDEGAAEATSLFG